MQSGNQKTAHILCFCGMTYTIKWVSTKTKGYWRYFNWDRHLKGHVRNNQNVNGNTNVYFG